MHDIDRTALEYEPETEYGYEFEDEMEGYYAGENEYEYEDEYEDEDEFEYEFEGEYEDESESEYEYEFESQNVFTQAEEMELAAELLSTSSDAELEEFLGKLIKTAGRKIRKFAKSKVGRALGKGLRSVAKRALPMVGRAVGTAFGGPVGGAIGSRLASGAGRVFGLELEGMSPEDQEFEVARRVVRLAGNSTKKVANVPANVHPVKAAQAAIVAAAKKDAPGLLRPTHSRMKRPMRKPRPSSRGASGRWQRRGNRIVLMGV